MTFDRSAPRRLMRRLGNLIPAFLTVPAVVFGQSCKVAGTWRLESSRYFRSPVDTGINVPVRELQIKVLNATHFAYLRQLGDSAILDESGRLRPVVGSRVWGGAGTYTTKGDEYVERFDVVEPVALVGTETRAKCTVVGTLWVHEFELSSGRTRLREGYRRIAP